MQGLQGFVGEAFKGRLAFCSNFFIHPMTYKEFVYPTAEHCYQSLKMRTAHHARAVAVARSPGAAKRLARTLPMKDGWDAIKVAVMREVVRAKFTDNALRSLLLRTGNEPLVEVNYWHDTYWGVCEGVGENHLGKILMHVRDEIRRL